MAMLKLDIHAKDDVFNDGHQGCSGNRISEVQANEVLVWY